MNWNSSDAWLLQTIMQSTIRNSTADLSAIISVGDYINHAIFNWEEFRDGMENLLRAKYVKENKGAISLTATFHKDYKAMGKAPKSMNKEYEFVQAFLQAKTTLLEGEKVKLNIGEKDFKLAVDKYLKR